MRSFIIISLFSIVLMSCEETIPLDLDQSPSKIVIEGLVTNRPGRQSVKITRSSDFYSRGATPRVTNAVVSVKDDLGESISFVHNPNGHADSAGIYIPIAPFTGQIGRTYTLTVTVDEEAFEATDKLYSVIPVDSLNYQISDDEVDDPKKEGKVYEMLLYAREPQNEDNFYLFKFFRNDSLTYYDETDVYYSDDELLAEKIDGVPSPPIYGLGDTGKVEIYSLSRFGYVYFNDLSTILNNDGGGMFGPVPASPRNNLSNGALGFFQVSAVNATSIKIE
jgi:hypothetical protein